MKRTAVRVTGYILAGALAFSGPAPTYTYGSPTAGVTAAASETADNTSAAANAATTGNEMAGLEAGVSLAMSNCLISSNEIVMQSAAMQKAAEQEEQVSENEVPIVASEYEDIAIAQVDNYVNVRSEPSTESEVLGKLYNKSAATVLETTDNGWYRITSGSVTGYVKCEYVVTGDEELAREVSTRYAKVTTTTLNVRTEPSTESSILIQVPIGDDLVVLDESIPGWAKVTTEEGEGYVSADYVEFSTEFVHAESKAEEEARLAKEEQERKAAAAAAEAARKKSSKKSSDSSSESAPSGGGSTSYNAPSGSNGQAVVDYACQFVGNPYVAGGTSLTNGADCSGFVMSVYGAFGIGLPHSSSAMRSCGYEVSLADAQPGDIVCYSGHVGIYVGNGTIVHASTPSSGIKYSNVNYRSPICVRRIF
ncbi:MAG: SH3 domain-containing protein [Roseburia sp.]|nr:SH3 domain-containing protein [Roseburia sp.]